MLTLEQALGIWMFIVHSHSHTYFCRCVWDLSLMAFFSGIHRRHSWQWPLHRCHCRSCCVSFRRCFSVRVRRYNFSACRSLCAPHSIDRRMWALFDSVNRLHGRSRWFDRCWLALCRIHLKMRWMVAAVVVVGHSRSMESNWLTKGLWHPWRWVDWCQADGYAWACVFAKCCCAMWSGDPRLALSCCCSPYRSCRCPHCCREMAWAALWAESNQVSWYCCCFAKQPNSLRCWPLSFHRHSFRHRPFHLPPPIAIVHSGNKITKRQETYRYSSHAFQHTTNITHKLTISTTLDACLLGARIDFETKQDSNDFQKFCFVVPFSSSLPRAAQFLRVFAAIVHGKPDMIDIVNCVCVRWIPIRNHLCACESLHAIVLADLYESAGMSANDK